MGINPLYQDHITRCKEKLERLRLCYDNCNNKIERTQVWNEYDFTIGTSFYPFTLNPPLSTAYIERWEKKKAARLPEEYKLFLNHLGDGGGVFFNSLKHAETYNESPAEDDQFPVADQAGIVSFPNSILLACDNFDQTLLLLNGKARGYLFRYNSQGSDSINDFVLLNTSFFNWFELILDEKLQSIQKEHGEDTPEESAINYLSRQLGQINLFSPEGQITIAKKVTEALKQGLPNAVDYCSMIAGSAKNERHDLTVLIGEAALVKMQSRDIAFSHEQVLKLLKPLGTAYVNLKDERGIYILETHFEMSKDMSDYAEMANLLLSLNNPMRALSYVNKAPENYYSFWIKGKIYAALGEDALAKEQFQNGIAEQRFYAANHEGIADVFVKEKEYGKAIVAFQKAIQYDLKRSPVILYKVAELYALQNKANKVVNIFTLLQMSGKFDLNMVEQNPAFAKTRDSHAYQEFLLLKH